MLQGLRRVQDRVVLDGRGDDVWHRAAVRESEPCCPSDAAQGEVITLGRPTGEDDLPRFTPEDTSAGGARLIDRRARLLSQLIDAGRVSIPLGEVRQHRRQHLRVERGGRCVIEIDRVVHGVSCGQRVRLMRVWRHAETDRGPAGSPSSRLPSAACGRRPVVGQGRVDCAMRSPSVVESSVLTMASRI